VITSTQLTDTGGERLDLHNASIDEPAAAAGHCGMIHLPTGRICRAPARHDGGCEFGPAS
jgi:hypothetical protein